MHMADALAAPAVAGTMYVLSTAAATYSIKKVRLENNPKKIPLMGVMGAFVFAAQMINFTIPGTGSSGHLCGGMLLTAVLGPWAGFLAMIGILLIQCLIFADGGLLALGCNIWNMAFYGCFIGGLLIWKPFMKYGSTDICGYSVTKKRITAASIAACILTLQMGAFSVTLETLFSGITELPFTVFVSMMQPIHLAIGLVEGIVTAAVLCFVYEARPELIWTGEKESGKKAIGTENRDRNIEAETVGTKDIRTDAADTEMIGRKAAGKGRLSYKKTLGILALATAVTAGVLSFFASSNPDGLEWSMEKVAGTAELAASGSVYETTESIQNATALLPDYAFKFSDSAVGTTVSGLAGSALVVILCVAVCCIFRFFRKKNYG